MSRCRDRFTVEKRSVRRYVGNPVEALLRRFFVPSESCSLAFFSSVKFGSLEKMRYD